MASNGDTVYRVANLFTGFVFCERAKYISVAVQFISIQKKNEVVKIVQKEGVKPAIDMYVSLIFYVWIDLFGALHVYTK